MCHRWFQEPGPHRPPPHGYPQIRAGPWADAMGQRAGGCGADVKALPPPVSPSAAHSQPGRPSQRHRDWGEHPGCPPAQDPVVGSSRPGEMGDPFSRWSNPPPRTEYDDSPRSNGPAASPRPSGKSIYNQRKDYSQALLKPQSDFHHHVEHLLTVRLESDVRSAEDCLERLKVLEAQGRVWGQNLILQVKDQKLVLRDVESKEELDSHPLGSVQGCWAALDTCGYDSVLALSVQERGDPPGTTVLLFQCERPGAETLRSSLEKLVKRWKEEQRGHRSSLDMPLGLAPPYAQGPPERWAETPEPEFPAPPQRGLPASDYSESRVGFVACLSFPRSRGVMGEPSWDPLPSPGLPDTQQTPWTNPPGQAMSEVDRDVEVLNHVLMDLDLFVVRLKTALGLVNTTTTKKKKKKKKKGALPSKGDYTDFFQKVKYALNLMGRTHQHMQEPNPSDLLHLIFTALSFVLSHCPSPELAPAVVAPLLVPEAVELLEETLHQEDHHTWKTLGIAWNETRARYPNGELVPRYIPVFSDGWLPPPLEQVRRGGGQDVSPPASVSPAGSERPPFSLLPTQSPATGRGGNPSQGAPSPAQGLARALYEFQGRNPQELSVGMGDTLQVLDQRKKWWLVQDGRGDRGYVPSNILEPLGQGYGGGGRSAGQLQDSPPNLHPDSSPAEVTAWLKDKGFSRITVRCLGVLSGRQLLQMTTPELRAVCPEEWRRVLFKLSSVRTSLGMDPRD
ncbi:LOW QUALITY PROTEIN: epidermal growth factor receptor kinase substrate 8-like protein 3 [Opisthocomus hoazin]|uniref:LOW QUALITY PROTEIN: epidermal growth factor receptor kinase substrate 8-like protein 3 n=1 Tax=Opisthocomus hoazin TaxID=30419 RepID=UPI003F536DBF